MSQNTRDRRDFLKQSLAAAAGVGMSQFLIGERYKSAKGLMHRSNVLFVSVDDLNDWLGHLGNYPGVKTPNFDRLAAKGVSFARAFCNAPMCVPSRGSTLYGVHPLVSGMNGGDKLHTDIPLFSGLKSLPHLFREAGYVTLGGGKIFHGDYDYSKNPATWNPKSFEPSAWTQNFVNFGSEPMLNPHEGVEGSLSWGKWDSLVTEANTPDMQLAQWAAARLQEPSAQPFFMGVGFYRPHLPWFVPKRFLDLYPLDNIVIPNVPIDDLDDIPTPGLYLASPATDHEKILKAGKWKHAIQAYLASISFADHCFGIVLDALERGPHAGNTVVVLWGDHGWHLGEKLSWRKFKLWERSLRVPLIFAGADTARGNISPEIVGLGDLSATLLETCLGIQPPREEQRSEVRSFAPLLMRPRLAWNGQSVSVWRTETGLHKTLRTDKWRYIRYGDIARSEELYDHENDPNEWENLLSPRCETIDAALAPIVSGFRARLT
jgi:arylsulfatase A-like enzyme